MDKTNSFNNSSSINRGCETSRNDADSFAVIQDMFESFKS